MIPFGFIPVAETVNFFFLCMSIPMADFHSLLDAEIKTWNATSFALFPFVQFTEIICVCWWGVSLLKVWEDDRELNDKEGKKIRYS